jgi:hypothetical protein
VTVRLAKLGPKTVTAWWYNPRDGSAERIGEVGAAADHEFKPAEAGRGKDVVLVVDDAGKGWGAPGAGAGMRTEK